MGSFINQEISMSNTVRWLVAIMFVLAGIITAVFSLAFLGFFTWECYGPTNSTASAILYVAAAIGLIGGIVPAVMLVRKADGKFLAIAIVLSIVLTLTGNGVFMFYTLNIC
jgi:hypothetical protein